MQTIDIKQYIQENYNLNEVLNYEDICDISANLGIAEDIIYNTIEQLREENSIEND